MKSRRYRLVFRILVAVVSIQLLVGTIAAVYWFDFPNCLRDQPASDEPEYIGQTLESIAMNPHIVRLDSSCEFTLNDPMLAPRQVIQNYIADPEEELLECEYSTDRGGSLTVFFRIRADKWVSFSSHYLPKGWVY